MFYSFSDSAAVVGLSMLPILENRAGVLYAIVGKDFSPLAAVLYSTLGSILLLLVLTPTLYRFGHRLMKRWPIVAAALDHIAARHSRKLEHAYEIGIVMMVAAPVPVTGVWSAVAVAFLLGVPMWHTIGYAALGSLLGSALVAGLTVGFFNLF